MPICNTHNHAGRLAPKSNMAMVLTLSMGPQYEKKNHKPVKAQLQPTHSRRGVLHYIPVHNVHKH